MDNNVLGKGLVFAVVVLFISAFNGMLMTTPNVQAADSVDHVLITAVYYDTYMSYEPEEFVRISNPTNSIVNLSGWSIRITITSFSMRVALLISRYLLLAGV